MGSTQIPMEKVQRNLSQGEICLSLKLPPYPHVVQRLRMSGAILPLLLYTFMTCTGTICLYFYVFGGAGEVRKSFTFEILTDSFQLIVTDKIFHSSIHTFIQSFIHSCIESLFFLSVFTPFVASSFF